MTLEYIECINNKYNERVKQYRFAWKPPINEERAKTLSEMAYKSGWLMTLGRSFSFAIESLTPNYRRIGDSMRAYYFAEEYKGRFKPYDFTGTYAPYGKMLEITYYFTYISKEKPSNDRRIEVRIYMPAPVHWHLTKEKLKKFAEHPEVLYSLGNYLGAGIESIYEYLGSSIIEKELTYIENLDKDNTYKGLGDMVIDIGGRREVKSQVGYKYGQRELTNEELEKLQATIDRFIRRLFTREYEFLFQEMSTEQAEKEIEKTIKRRTEDRSSEVNRMVRFIPRDDMNKKWCKISGIEPARVMLMPRLMLVIAFFKPVGGAFINHYSTDIMTAYLDEPCRKAIARKGDVSSMDLECRLLYSFYKYMERAFGEEWVP